MSKVEGLERMLRNHLGRVWFVDLIFIPQCNEVKTLEAMAIYKGLESVSSLNLSNILVEFNCFEVVHLLNDVVDIFDFSLMRSNVWGLSWVLYLFLMLGRSECACAPSGGKGFGEESIFLYPISLF